MTVEGTVTILLDRQKASVPTRRERDPAGKRPARGPVTAVQLRGG